MTRDVRFDVRGTCGFSYEVMLPETELAQVGDLIPPMQIENNYVLVPNGAADRADGSVELGMMCGSADAVQFTFEVSAPNGNDDSMFVQLDDGELMTFHIPRTGADGGAIGTGAAADTGHACTHANCANQVYVDCTALGGILVARNSGLDVCIPAVCGPAGPGCSSRGGNLPRLRSGGAPCCPGAIARQAAADMGESDRCANGVCADVDGIGGVISSFCGDTGVVAPCALPMEFEWRSFMQEFDVTPGKHSLYIKAREDGTKIRAVSFAQRGTCGWAPDLLLPRTIDTTFGTVTAPMVKQDDFVYTPNMGTVYGTRANPSNPTVCNPARGDACGKLQLHFSCAGPSEIDFELDIAAIQGQNQVYLGIDADVWAPGDHPPTFYAKVTIEHTQTEGPDCDDPSINGIRGGDACCPTSCGTCGGSSCGSRDPTVFAVPGDPTSSSGCCQGSISRTDRICGDPGVTAPCISPDPFEWRVVGGGVRGAQVFVEGGDHTLEIFSAKDGAKIRNIRFTDRGSCVSTQAVRTTT